MHKFLIKKMADTLNTKRLSERQTVLQKRKRMCAFPLEYLRFTYLRKYNDIET